MPDLFTILSEDHRNVEGLLAELEGNVGDGNELAERLVGEESRHEAAEEMFFWPIVEVKVEGGRDLVSHGLEQEREGKELLDELRKTDPASHEFGELITRFAAAGRQHIHFEEQEVWPRLQARLSPLEREELGQDFKESKESAPTRPHPHSSDNPLALRTTGALTAKVDKLRDAATRRQV